MNERYPIRGLAGVLRRLRRDARGNTIALMAAAMFPLLGMTGSAIDYTRLVLTKTRLQQACDAGVLAGRKFMADSNAALLDANAVTQAQNFFRSNFRAGWLRTSGVVFTPVKTVDRQVSATATATVPMVLMDYFGSGPRTLSVSCEARFDVADVDIMFVLDTTGSMACVAADASQACKDYVVANTPQNPDGSWSAREKTNSRLAAVRLAVKDFYATLSAAADPSTHIRIGFVPYSTTVNVGRLLPRNFLAANVWTYQSRSHVGDYAVSTSTSHTNNTGQTACNNQAVPRSPTSGYTTNSQATQTVTSWAATNGGRCTKNVYVYGPQFRYQPVSHTITNFAAGQTVDNPVAVPTAPGVARPTSRWGGCIEERDTTTATTFNLNSLPPDLDVDTAPTTNIASQWRPFWPEVIFERSSAAAVTINGSTINPLTWLNRTRNMWSDNLVACPMEARQLTAATAQNVAAFVDSPLFRPHGLTYHDIGMIWGIRMLSPDGIFRNDTAAWPGRNPPNRYIIFLTDGDMENYDTAYTAHGYEIRDNRVAPAGSSIDTIEARHNTRFGVACDIATERKNIKVYVVAYAQAMTTELQNCASPEKAFPASNDTALRAAFREIAQQIAMLRLTR